MINDGIWHSNFHKKKYLNNSFFVLVADFLLTICSNYDVFLTRDCLGLLENKVCSESDRETHPYFQCDSLVKHGICVTRSYSSGRCKFHRRVVWQFGTVSCLDDPGLNVSLLLFGLNELKRLNPLTDC